MSGDAATRPDLPAATKDCGCGPLEPCKAHLGAGDLQDWEARARAAEAKLGTLRGLCREHGSTLTPGDVLRIIGSEQEK